MLNYHLNTVHSTIKRFQCQYCSAAYKHKGDLTKHMRGHLGDDLYQCPECPKRFRTPFDRQIHTYEHYKGDEAKSSNTANSASVD